MTHAWEWMLLYAGCCGIGGLIGIVAGKWRRRKHPFDRHRVNHKCLSVGHRWERRMKGVPIQFCRRHGCMGARVSPEAIEQLPADLVTHLRQHLDEDAALSLDERP